MGIEIERKFLVTDNWDWRLDSNPNLYRQGYLNSDKNRTVRVRTSLNDGCGFLTVKGLTVGASRPEFEYEIPYDEAEQLLKLCERPLIEKYRSTIKVLGMTWEIDEFVGENKGLIIAEIELKEEAQQFQLPKWVGEEVTGDPRYYNSSLVKLPFTQWIKG